MVPLIIFAFFSCNITIRDSTESSMQRRVMTPCMSQHLPRNSKFGPQRCPCVSIYGRKWMMKPRRKLTRTLLADTVATISGLPLGGRVPPAKCSSATCNNVRKISTYGSMMNTREASVRFKATPPAFSDTRKTSTSVLFMKYSIDFWR